MRRIRFALTGLFMLASVIAVPALPAQAACADAGTIYYKFTNVSTSKILSNLRSDYLQGPGSITYSETKTAQVSASMTATVSAEAGIVFAKASASLGVTVGASWSKSGSWSYTKPVPSGTTARLVMWHQSRHFTVTKTRLDALCHSVTVYQTPVNAPLTTNLNVWGLQNA